MSKELDFLNNYPEFFVWIFSAEAATGSALEAFRDKHAKSILSNSKVIFNVPPSDLRPIFEQWRQTLSEAEQKEIRWPDKRH